MNENRTTWVRAVVFALLVVIVVAIVAYVRRPDTAGAETDTIQQGEYDRSGELEQDVPILRDPDYREEGDR